MIIRNDDFGKFIRDLRSLDDIPRQTVLRKDSKPSVLNLNIIDTCNSRCTMCNIWKNDPQVEITPENLQRLLSDDLYKNLQHVGVTGGEPTLRKDLPEVFETIISTLPKIKGVSMITNAINLNEIKNSIEQVKKKCDERNVPLSVMVSIDGVSKTHDKIRGVKNNFSSALDLYKFLDKELKIPVTFGCTISKNNVWEVDDLLYFAKKNSMTGRFRIAEFINRLYNDNRKNVIRNFSDDEIYNLVIFFEKLKNNYETSNSVKRTYSSIQSILLGGSRLTGCPYHNDGIVVGAKGQINYCAPKSKDIGNGVNSSSKIIFKDNFSQKAEIVSNYCKDCIHDYHSPITYKEKVSEIKNFMDYKILRIENADLLAIYSRKVEIIPKQKNKKRIFILGWYGTETVGDKAILGGIIQKYLREEDCEIEFVIGSLYPFVTKRTCKELNIQATVVSTKSFDLIRYAKSSDEVVMGGGPLMDLVELYVPLIAFKVARLYNIKTTICGCGIGPLYIERFENAVKDILANSTEIYLRDEASIIKAKEYGTYKATLSGDFAKPYIKENYILQKFNRKEKVIRCYLRAWTHEYSRNISKQEFEQLKHAFEHSLAKFIRKKAAEIGCKNVILEHMHNFVVGNDDRDFSRYFIDKHFSEDTEIVVSMNKKLSTVDSIIRSMQASSHNICMRFHSVLFAHTLQSDFTAIDYTLGGKIYQYLKDNDTLHAMITPSELIAQ